MGTRRARRQREAALEELVARGVRTGERRGIARTIWAISRRIIGREVSETLDVLSSEGIGAALRFVVRVSKGEWPRRWQAVLEGPLEEAIQSQGEGLGGDFDLSTENPRMKDYFDNHLVTLSTQLSDTTQRQLTDVIRDAQREGLSVPDTSERVREVMPAQTEKRAALIARNELLKSSKTVAFFQAAESGVADRKRRQSAEDSRVRPLHMAMNGETVGIWERYSNGELFCSELDIGCRCVDIFLLEGEE